jgi:predicted GIY-YIG superfamily endonuclease
MTTYVYIIAKKDGDKLVSPVKVGIADDPEKRLKQLRTSCPFPLALVCCFACDTRDEALIMERKYRSYKLVKRLHGEWFDMEPRHAAWMMICNFSDQLARNRSLPEVAKLIDENLDQCKRFNEALYA